MDLQASAGTLGCAPGSVTANSDSLDIMVTGTGGHASAPHGTVDPVVVATQFIILEKGQVRARRGAGPRPARGLPRS